MNPAHWFTFLRLALSPLFPLFYLGYEELGIPLTVLPYLMLSILLVSEFSDVFDGMLARSRNEVTDLGKVLDPMADSVTHISLFLAFTQGFVQLPLMLVLVFLYRDLFITTLRSLCALKGVALAARLSGKVKTILQGGSALLIVALMIPYTAGVISLALYQKISLIAVSIAAFYTLISIADYVYANRLYIRKAF